MPKHDDHERILDENFCMNWLPTDFVHPLRVSVGAGGHHLRPIHPDDTDPDMVAVMSSQARLWSIYGEAWVAADHDDR